MAHLVDTSILGRLANTADAFHAAAARAVVELHRRGEVLHVTPQNLVEFRNVATRPTAVNGLGLSLLEAEAKAAAFEAAFPLLAETPDIYPAWKTLVGALG
jgi:predicted nucleic acid-binding protein